MKKILLLILSIAVFQAYGQRVIPGVVSSSKKVSVNVVPEDFFIHDPRTADEPLDYSTIEDADFFWDNVYSYPLRSSQHWSGLNYSIEIRDGRERFHFHINPRTPDFSGSGHYNYRAEIARTASATHPAGTREWLGYGYIVPETGFKPHANEFAIQQWHTGTAPGGPFPLNSPVIYFGIAFAGQTDQYLDAAVINELVIVNKPVDFETAGNGRTNTGIVFDAGERHEFVEYLEAGIGSAGKFKVWHREKPNGGEFGAWTLIYDENESTMWAENDDGGSNSLVMPYWKLGLYVFGVSTLAGTEEEEDENGGSPGSYSVDIDLTAIRNIPLLSNDPYYNRNFFNMVDTSNY
jgi:hypothetical protein